MDELKKNVFEGYEIRKGKTEKGKENKRTPVEGGVERPKEKPKKN